MADKWYTVRDDFSGPLNSDIWTVTGSHEPIPSAASGELIFHITAAETMSTTLASSFYDIEDSFVSFRVLEGGHNKVSGDYTEFQILLNGNGSGNDYYLYFHNNESANLSTIQGESGAFVNLDYNAQPYVAFSKSGDVLTVWYSLDGVTWTVLGTKAATWTGGFSQIILTASTTDADNVNPYEARISDLNIVGIPGYNSLVTNNYYVEWNVEELDHVSVDLGSEWSLEGDVSNDLITEWNIDSPPVPLFEELVESFYNLDQWVLGGSHGADPEVADNAVRLITASGSYSDRSVETVDSYSIINSWISFRLKAVGAYPEEYIAVSLGAGGAVAALTGYPGRTGVTLVVGPTFLDLPADSQPYILVYADDTNVTFAYALDSVDAGAGNWTTFVGPESISDFALDGPVKLKILGQAFTTTASADAVQEVDQINQFNLAGPVAPPAPELTEVDASALVTNWNVLTLADSTVATSWYVMTTAAQTVSSNWNLAAIASHTMDSTWTAAGFTDKTLSTSWNTLSMVEKTVTMYWTQTHPFLRHSTRHVHQTMLDYITDQLGLLGWTIPGSVPFGAPAVAIMDGFPDEWDETSVLDPGVMVLTLGDENSAKEEELGPLTSIEIPFFVDCFMDTDGVALALSLDVRDILVGRFPTSRCILNVNNYNSSPTTLALGYQVEIEDVTRDRIKNKWHVVKFTAMLYFNDGR